ncbi:MAG: TadE/TadG family type IV pilus assembly protein [Candidatus Zixiibacteriota bacterium]
MRITFIKERKGQSLIEFALVLPILLLVLFGITEFGRAIMTVNMLHTAAREGARYAAVRAVSDSTSAVAKVQDVLDAASIKNSTIDIEYLEAEKAVRVRVTTDFKVLTGKLLDPFMGTITLKGETVMRHEG